MNNPAFTRLACPLRPAGVRTGPVTSHQSPDNSQVTMPALRQAEGAGRCRIDNRYPLDHREEVPMSEPSAIPPSQGGWNEPPPHPPKTQPSWARLAAAILALVVTSATMVGPPPDSSWGRVEIGGGVTVDLGHGLAFAVTALLCAVLLPHVSYRRRDWLFIAFVPIWNIVVACRLGWRLALLPYRDWPPRPDERGRVRAIPGTELYELDPQGEP